MNYTDASGKNQGILLQGDKSNFRAIIVALQGVTGVAVSVGDKDRNEIPAGVAVQTVKQPEEPAQPVPAASSAALPASTSPEGIESMQVNSNPDGADVYVDGSFVGNAPATLKLKPGKHTITVKQSGYKDWSREVSTEAGAEAHISATLEKQ